METTHSQLSLMMTKKSLTSRACVLNILKDSLNAFAQEYGLKLYVIISSENTATKLNARIIISRCSAIPAATLDSLATAVAKTRAADPAIQFEIRGPSAMSYSEPLDLSPLNTWHVTH